MRNAKKAGVRKILLITISTIFLLFVTANATFAAPRIVSVTPPIFSQQDQVTEVSAIVYGAVSLTSMIVDGTPVNGTITGDTIRFEKVFLPGLHKIYFSVTDGSGSMAEKSWEFYVNDPLKKYILPDNGICSKCHPSTWKNFPGHMVDLRLTGFGHPHSCGTCHAYNSGGPLITRSDGSSMAQNCMDCHSIHHGVYLDPVHDSVYWNGTWPETAVTIKTPRTSFDCQYCHQSGTLVRMGHDLVSDHKVDDPQCVSCHSNILTVAHNSNGLTCNTCHQSANPAIQSVVKDPMVAKAGSHYSATNTGPGKGVESYVYRYFNDLNLEVVSLTAYGPNTEVVSPEWSPGPGLEIKRLKVDDWKAADKQYILAYVEDENKWYRLSVADDGKVLYKRYPSDSPARAVYLPRGTTKIKTMVISGIGDITYSSGLTVKEAYYGRPAKCTDCHAQTIHEPLHSYSFDQACLTCHLSSLTGEHMSNPKTQTKSLTCDTCHKSSNPVVNLAVIKKDKQCSGCHSKAHNFNVVPNVPLDLPLYTGFSWTSPVSAKTWAKESWIPVGMADNGKVLVSSLRNDVTGQNIEGYYDTEMTAASWVKAVRNGGAGYLQLQYTKGARSAYIFWYNGMLPHTGDTTSTGFRLLILYN